MMKLSVSNIAWLSEETDSILPILYRHGVTGIEIAPTLLFKSPEAQTDEAIRLERSKWEHRGLKIVAMQALLFGHPEFQLFGESQIVDKLTAYMKMIIHMGGLLGARALVFGSPKNRIKGGLSFSEALESAVPFFSELAQYASESGTCLCIEPNATGYGCDFVTTVAEAVELVRAVNHPGFALNLDAGVMTMNSETYETAIVSALPYMRHCHISEPYLGKITDSLTDHKRLALSLRDSNYEGWLSIEMKSGLGDNNITLVDECLEYVKRVYCGES